MQKTSGQFEKEMIESLAGTTGRDLASWLTTLDSSGITKRNEMIAWLKSEHGFGHMNASLLAGLHANGGKPVYADTSELLEIQFAKAESMRPLFDELVGFITGTFESITVLPKKTYVSILEKREFAAINIKKAELRLGLDLGDRPFDDRVGKAKLTGPMPRISHQIVITEASQLDDSLARLLKDSYVRSN
jgi:predicted transport protein